jgi:AraC-like DNA-binding protein
MDRALAYVDRHYAKELTDAVVADQIGLSTSHFRFLFRQSTGQPFHRYLVNLRLEKAKQLLTDRGTSVGDAAKAVGFSGLAHFSRAFQARFHISPTAAKRQNS